MLAAHSLPETDSWTNGRAASDMVTSKREVVVSIARLLLVVFCSIVLASSDALAYMQSSQTANKPPSKDQVKKSPPEQLDSLIAPIALYPDPLLAQTLAAATYPLEIVQLQQWLEKNKHLKDKELVQAVAK